VIFSAAISIFAWMHATVVAVADGKPMTFLQAPANARSFKITLAVPNHASSRQGFLAQRSPQPLEELSSIPAAISEACAGKEFWAFEVATLPDGTRYLAVLIDDKTVKFLNRNNEPVWRARIYKLAPWNDAKPELLREGLQSSGNDVMIPVEMEVPGIGAIKVKTLRTEVGYNVSGGYQGGKPQVYSGRGAAMTVSGSQVLPEGKVTVTVNVPDEMMVTPNTQITLQFEPLTPGLPDRTASGKITDYLSLESARFMVTDLASDFSVVAVAVTTDSLEETLKRQLQLGAQMPAFSQVDLVTRKTITREELLARAKNSAGIIFVFGDLQSSAGPSPGVYIPPMHGGMGLPLPTAEVAEQAGLDQAKPLLVLITRQIGMEYLYQELRNKTPDYLVLSDYTDPLRTAFRTSQSGWYGPGGPYQNSHSPSLRQLFNLPDKLAVVAFDSSGKVVFVNADASGRFLPAFADARAALEDAPKGRGRAH